MEEVTRRGQRRLEQQRKRKIEKQTSGELTSGFIEDDNEEVEREVAYEDNEDKHTAKPPNRVRDKAAEAEAEKRIIEAKSTPAVAIPKAKKPKPTPKEEDDDIFIDDDEPASIPTDAKKLPSKGKRLVVDDEEE